MVRNIPANPGDARDVGSIPGLERASRKGICYTLQYSEKALTTHSSTLAWKIPWTEEPGRLLRVGHDWATSLSLFTFMHWRRKWQPTPVFFPGESQGQGSLMGCRLWGLTSWTWLMWLSSNSSQYSCLGILLERGAWWATVQRVTKNQIWLNSN